MEDRGPCRAAEPVSRVWPREDEVSFRVFADGHRTALRLGE